MLPAVQENKIDTQDKQIDKNVEVIHDRIEKHREEVTVEIEKSHRVIMDEIKALREDEALHHQLVSERLNKLEQWRWVVINWCLCSRLGDCKYTMECNVLT